jgi:hypothetical protein
VGRKTKVRSNPALGKSHEVGANVAVIQLLTHARYGAISYLWPRFWVFELRLADEAHTNLKRLHGDVLNLPPNDSKMRLIHDMELLQDVYCAGSDMVSHACRAVQHLAQQMEQTSRSLLQTTTSEDRIREAAALFGLDDHHAEQNYQGFVEILRIRDAVEHPQANNIYQVDGSRWDEVPLAWMLSERALLAYERFEQWMELLTTDWENYLKSHPDPPRTLTVERGLESLLQVKKPPHTEERPAQ